MPKLIDGLFQINADTRPSVFLLMTIRSDLGDRVFQTR
jgi:hypothetical protein